MKIYITIIALLSVTSCNQTQKYPILNVNKDAIDFGKIRIDSILKVYFDYQNTGSDTLKLISASTDCGCTDINYNKESLAPGEKGIIEVIYTPKSNNDSGFISKNIALRSNTLAPLKVIKIKGVVINN